MDMRLIEPKKKDIDQIVKTEVKVGLKEINNPVTRLYLMAMGLDIHKPNKETSRYKYYLYNGDWLNKDKDKQ